MNGCDLGPENWMEKSRIIILIIPSLITQTAMIADDSELVSGVEWWWLRWSVGGQRI